MRLILRFIMPLLCVLGLLVWIASVLVSDTFRRWSERDMRLRADLAANSAREELLRCLHQNDSSEMSRVLEQLVRDERIMGASLCGCDGRLIAASPEFPAGYDCKSVGGHVVVSGGVAGDPPMLVRWTEVKDGSIGRVHVSAIPIMENEQAAGFLTIVQDLSFVARRESQVRFFTVIAFTVLAVSASVLTVLVARLSRRTWTVEIRQMLRGRAAAPPEFQPIMRDFRELVAEISAEVHAGAQGRVWTAERLRQVLRQELHGERVIILANRQPYVHNRASDGKIEVQHPASGLVTALEPIMRACSGVWIAHGSGSADREVTDKKDCVRVPPGEESYTLRRVWLTPEEEKGYYFGFANEGLWPLCHLAHERPVFRRSDWAYYQSVNQKFADALAEEIDNDDSIILVQDYHYALAPSMIRKHASRATILTFWHIPWPNSERFGICPWQRELLRGLLGSSILGFHTQAHCNNFIDAIDRYLEARIDRDQQAVIQGGHRTLIRPYPISIECPSRWIRHVPPVAQCREEVISEFNLPRNALIGVGIDRLDYTKGIEERLLSVETLLERFPQFAGRFTFIQVAAPSRTAIERYKAYGKTIEQMTEAINAKFRRGEYRPVILLRRHHEPPDVMRFYRAADLCYVSSLHDGMNLVAKEFVSARDDERGVLVLSRFTGAARELTEALIVNPYDIEEASSGLAAALNMSEEEQSERMRAMRLYLTEFNVYRWAGRMLTDAARLRHRHRVSDRLIPHLGPGELPLI
ncbi:MAG: trehalose-6-phosphate synthase [Acidobacteriota bacterium]